MKPNPQWVRLAAVLGFLAVALGAMGAHGPLHKALEQHDTVEFWKTASQYHLAHSIVILVLAFVGASGAAVRFAQWSFLVGILLFSGSLYVLAVSNIRPLGAITPFGGASFLLGWLLTAFGKWRE